MPCQILNCPRIPCTQFQTLMLYKIHSSLQLCVHMKNEILLVSDIVVHRLWCINVCSQRNSLNQLLFHTAHCFSIQRLKLLRTQPFVYTTCIIQYCNSQYHLLLCNDLGLPSQAWTLLKFLVSSCFPLLPWPSLQPLIGTVGLCHQLELLHRQNLEFFNCIP